MNRPAQPNMNQGQERAREPNDTSAQGGNRNGIVTILTTAMLRLLRSSTTRRLSLQCSTIPEDDGIRHLTEDTFNFLLVTEWKIYQNFPIIFMAGLIFSLQMTIYGLVIFGTIDLGSDDNILNFPSGVDGPTQVAEFLAIIITTFSQEDFRTAIVLMCDNHDLAWFVADNNGQAAVTDLEQGERDETTTEIRPFKEKYSKACRSKKWFSVFLRLVAGISSIFVTFVLIMQSDDVVDLLLNFTAIEFVSNLDDVGFALSKSGFFGEQFRSKAKEIGDDHQFKVKIRTREQDNEQSSCFKSLSSYIRVRGRRILLLLTFIALAVGWSIVRQRQWDGCYTEKSVYVQMSDEIQPELAAFSGHYRYKRSGYFMTEQGPIVYESRFHMDDDTQKRAYFTFCKEIPRHYGTSSEGAWVFAKGEGDPCHNWMVRSDVENGASSRSDRFNILNHASARWVATIPDDDHHKGHSNGHREAELEHFRIFPSRSNDEEECDEATAFGPRCEYRVQPQCTSLVKIQNEDIQTSKEDVKIIEPYFNILQDGDGKLIYVQERPVFYSKDETNVVFFNGRRWVLAPKSSLKGVTEEDDAGRADLVNLMTNFHPFFTNYVATFMSDPVNIDTSSDDAYPTDDLNWYNVRKDIEPNVPYVRENIGSTLRCCDGENCQLEQAFMNECPIGEKSVILQVRYDADPKETSIEYIIVGPNDNSETTSQLPTNDIPETSKVHQFCVPEKSCTTLTISDSEGDGIQPPGGYEVWLGSPLNVTTGPFQLCASLYVGTCERNQKRNRDCNIVVEEPPEPCQLCAGAGGAAEEMSGFDPDELLLTDPFRHTYLFDGARNCEIINENVATSYNTNDKRCEHIQATYGDACGCNVPTAIEEQTCRICGNGNTIPSGLRHDRPDGSGETCLYYEMSIQESITDDMTCDRLRQENAKFQLYQKGCCEI